MGQEKHHCHFPKQKLSGTTQAAVLDRIKVVMASRELMSIHQVMDGLLANEPAPDRRGERWFEWTNWATVHWLRGVNVRNVTNMLEDSGEFIMRWSEVITWTHDKQPMHLTIRTWRLA